MGKIDPPSSYFLAPKEATNIAMYLELVSEWHKQHNITEEKFLSGVWFRGHGSAKYALCPGVYRDEFEQIAKNFPYGADLEEKRLNLEREILMEFRASGASLLNADNLVDVYFIAQHYGMPTRLLDWTTNPLAALFFAVENEERHTEDGEVFIMAANETLPSVEGNQKLLSVVSMRHPYVTDAIHESFWIEPAKCRKPIIIPVRPDTRPGRMWQQSSCFTIHMRNSGPCKNGTLAKVKVPSSAKADLLEQLHRLNINQFTIYNDLDHLSKDIKRAWGITK
ncbi:MAG: FRG domain-containing protein [Syntrophobacteraceae bacterium]